MPDIPSFFSVRRSPKLPHPNSPTSSVRACQPQATGNWRRPERQYFPNSELPSSKPLESSGLVAARQRDRARGDRAIRTSVFSARAVWASVLKPWGMRVGAIALPLTLASCTVPTAFSHQPAIPRTIQIQQDWPLQPGRAIAGYDILGGMGDVSIDLSGATIYAPFDGETYLADLPHCILFASPEVPAYLLRLCGLRRPHVGLLRQGDPIGSGSTLHFATLRKQPDGRWALVEPALSLVEQTLTAP